MRTSSSQLDIAVNTEVGVEKDRGEDADPGTQADAVLEAVRDAGIVMSAPAPQDEGVRSDTAQIPAPGPLPVELPIPPAPLLPPRYSPTGTPEVPLPRRPHKRRKSGNTVLTLVGLALVVAVCFDIGLRLRPVAAVVVVSPDASVSASGNAQAEAAIADARKAWRDGNADAALSDLRAVVAQFPDTAEAGEAQLQIADIALARGQTKEAKLALDAFLRSLPTHARAAEAFLRRGGLEEDLNDLSAAEADYREVLKFSGSLLAPDAHLRLGLLLKKRNRMKEARDELGVALRLSRAGDNVNRQAFDALLKLQKQ